MACAAALFAPSSAAQPKEYSVSIRDGGVARAQRVLVVQQDAQVRIAWSADQPTTVHLEGYDLSVVVQPGRAEAIEFKAAVTGRFAVHAHSGEQRGKHAHRRSALMWLEVHPK